MGTSGAAGSGGAPAESGEKKHSSEGGTTTVSEVPLRLLHGLPAALRVAERIVTQNSYHDQHLAYRNIMQVTPLPPRTRHRRAVWRAWVSPT